MIFLLRTARAPIPNESSAAWAIHAASNTRRATAMVQIPGSILLRMADPPHFLYANPLLWFALSPRGRGLRRVFSLTVERREIFPVLYTFTPSRERGRIRENRIPAYWTSGIPPASSYFTKARILFSIWMYRPTFFAGSTLLNLGT